VKGPRPSSSIPAYVPSKYMIPSGMVCKACFGGIREARGSCSGRRRRRGWAWRRSRALPTESSPDEGPVALGAVETGAFLQIAGESLEAGDNQKLGEAKVAPDEDGDDDEDVEREHQEPAVFRTVKADGAQEAVDDAQGRARRKSNKYAAGHEREHKRNRKDAAEPLYKARAGLKNSGERDRNSDL